MNWSFRSWLPVAVLLLLLPRLSLADMQELCIQAPERCRSDSGERLHKLVQRIQEDCVRWEAATIAHITDKDIYGNRIEILCADGDDASACKACVEEQTVHYVDEYGELVACKIDSADFTDGLCEEPYVPPSTEEDFCIEAPATCRKDGDHSGSWLRDLAYRITEDCEDWAQKVKSVTVVDLEENQIEVQCLPGHVTSCLECIKQQRVNYISSTAEAASNVERVATCAIEESNWSPGRCRQPQLRDFCLRAPYECRTDSGDRITKLASRILEDCNLWAQSISSITEVDRDGNKIEVQCPLGKESACLACIREQKVLYAEDNTIMTCAVLDWLPQRC